MECEIIVTWKINAHKNRHNMICWNNMTRSKIVEGEYKIKKVKLNEMHYKKLKSEI